MCTPARTQLVHQRGRSTVRRFVQTPAAIASRKPRWEWAQTMLAERLPGLLPLLAPQPPWQ